MTHPATRILMERLLWPVPRVRWEAARGIARLIRQADKDAAEALLTWISSRKLESEAVLGLDVIEAFDLGSYFDFVELSGAVQAPSHLSNLILRHNFSDARDLSPFRFAVSPEESATLPLEAESWFERYRKWAVPPVFSIQLEELERKTGFSFLARWRHEWRWLQSVHKSPPAEYPQYFSAGDRARRGQVDHMQREIYVSAFLRTLAYATMRGTLTCAEAEHLSLCALPFTRGLGDLEPVERPVWTYDLAPRASESAKDLAACLWSSATEACETDETPIALRTFEVSKDGFIEFDIKLVIEPRTHDFIDRTKVKEFSRYVQYHDNGRFESQLGQHPIVNFGAINRQISLAELFLPESVGRAHIGIASSIRLASPRIFGVSPTIACRESEIRLETTDQVLSRWVHWYADWEPFTFPELGPNVCWLASVSQSHLEQIQRNFTIRLTRRTMIRRGTRSSGYGQCKVESDVFSH